MLDAEAGKLLGGLGKGRRFRQAIDEERVRDALGQLLHEIRGPSQFSPSCVVHGRATERQLRHFHWNQVIWLFGMSPNPEKTRSLFSRLIASAGVRPAAIATGLSSSQDE